METMRLRQWKRWDLVGEVVVIDSADKVDHMNTVDL